MTDRRSFIRTLIGGAAALSLSGRAFGRESSSPITATRLTDDLALITGAGANVVVVTGPDGLLMVNGGLTERSAELTKFITSEFGTGHIQALFNTDWHLENTGLNETLRNSGAKIIA